MSAFQRTRLDIHTDFVGKFKRIDCDLFIVQKRTDGTQKENLRPILKNFLQELDQLRVC